MSGKGRKRGKNPSKRAGSAMVQGSPAPTPNMQPPLPPAESPGESPGDQVGSPPPLPRRRTFSGNGLKGVRLELADTAYRLKAGAPVDGTIDPRRANALTYTLATLAAVLKDEKQLGELAERIAKLEEFAARSGATSTRPVLMPLNNRPPAA